jgi:hypothetical protein
MHLDDFFSKNSLQLASHPSASERLWLERLGNASVLEIASPAGFSLSKLTTMHTRIAIVGLKKNARHIRRRSYSAATSPIT